MITVVRPEALTDLQHAVDEAVTLGGLPTARRDELILPLHALDLIAACVPGVIRESPADIERMRLLVTAGIGAVPAGAVAPEALSTTAAVGRSPAPPPPCTNGIVHLGGLCLALLAARRAGLRDGVEDALGGAVLAIAAACIPAESVLRAHRSGLDPTGLATLVRVLLSPRSSTPALSAAFGDPCALARWSAIEELRRTVFARESSELSLLPPRFGGADLVVRPHSCDATSVTVTVSTTATPATTRVDIGKTAAFMLCRFDGPPVPAITTRVPEGFTVAIPEPPPFDWVAAVPLRGGVATPEGVNRVKMRDALARLPLAIPALALEPVPTDEVVDLQPAPPGPTAWSRVHTGRARITTFTATSTSIPAHGMATLHWLVQGAERVTLGRSGRAATSVPVIGDRAVPWTAEMEQTWELRASGRCGDPILGTLTLRPDPALTHVKVAGPTAGLLVGTAARVHVSWDPPQPAVATVVWNDEVFVETRGAGSVVIDVPGGLVRVENSVLTMLSAMETTEGTAALFDQDRRSVLATSPSVRPLAIVRPLDRSNGAPRRVSIEDLAAAVARVTETTGILLQTWEPSELIDDVLDLALRPSGPDAADLPRWFSMLDRLAADAPGAESRTWVLLLPDLDGTAGFASIHPGESAVALAVATPSALEILATAELGQIGSVSPRLHIGGDLLHGAVRDFRGIRSERRAAGPGAPLATGLEVVVVSEDEAELHRQPLRVHAITRPTPIAALVPIDPAAARIEIREFLPFPEQPPGCPTDAGFSSLPPITERVLATIERPPGAPRLEDVAIAEDGTIVSRASHTAWFDVALALRADNAGTATFRAVTPDWDDLVPRTDPADPTARIDGSDTGPRVRVRTETSDPPREVSLVVSDGWNTANANLGPVLDPALPARLRRTRDGALWVDVRAGATAVRWDLPGGAVVTGIVLPTPPSEPPLELQIDDNNVIVRFTSSTVVIL